MKANNKASSEAQDLIDRAYALTILDQARIKGVVEVRWVGPPPDADVAFWTLCEAKHSGLKPTPDAIERTVKTLWKNSIIGDSLEDMILLLKKIEAEFVPAEEDVPEVAPASITADAQRERGVQRIKEGTRAFVAALPDLMLFLLRCLMTGSVVWAYWNAFSGDEPVSLRTAFGIGVIVRIIGLLGSDEQTFWRRLVRSAYSTCALLGAGWLIQLLVT